MKISPLLAIVTTIRGAWVVEPVAGGGVLEPPPPVITFPRAS